MFSGLDGGFGGVRRFRSFRDFVSKGLTGTGFQGWVCFRFAGLSVELP